MMNTVSEHYKTGFKKCFKCVARKNHQKAAKTTLFSSSVYCWIPWEMISSILKITWAEVFFDEFSDIICLGMDSQSLNLNRNKQLIFHLNIKLNNIINNYQSVFKIEITWVMSCKKTFAGIS